MIRYEIYSNIASSDIGLQEYLELQDLVDSFHAMNIDARIVKQVSREEDEINIASGQFARGVKVRSKAIREVRPETSLKGCLSWLRNVVSRVDRGLHLQLENGHATNGVPLVLGQIYARKQRAFLSKMGDGIWERLTVIPDLTLKKVPAGLSPTTGVGRKYMERRSRPTSFMASLDMMTSVDFIPEDRRLVYAEIVKKRNSDAFNGFSEAEVINLGLISEGLQRYQSILAEFFEQVYHTENVAELSTMFELLCQGVSFTELKKRFLDFALEAKRERIQNKRTLINEIRIGLSNADGTVRAEFEKRFSNVALKQRLLKDPALYKQTVRLEDLVAEEQSISTEIRDQLATLLPEYNAFRDSEPGAEDAIPHELKLKLFEMVVKLNYMGEYPRDFPRGVPLGATFARGLLSCFSFKVFNVGKLRNLNPKLPARGVARNLADKIPVTWNELTQIHDQLRDIVFPKEELVQEMASTIQQRYKDEAEQRRADELKAYLGGSYPLIVNSNYVLGYSGLTLLMRESLLAAGETLGFSMIASRTLVRNRPVEESEDGSLGVEGYHLLMNRDGDELLPLKVHPDTLLRAYNFLISQRVANMVRRFVQNKLNFLFEKHGGGLFEEIYQEVVWTGQLTLSRRQVAAILATEGVFEGDRLKQIGFFPEEIKNIDERENSFFLIETPDRLREGPHPMEPKAVEQRYRQALQAMEALRESYLQRPEKADDRSIQGVLARLSREDILNPNAAAFREALAESSAAETLWGVLETTIRANFDKLFKGAQPQEAIEVALPGPLACLALLKDSHAIEIDDTRFLFRVLPKWDASPGDLDSRSRVLATQVLEQVRSSGGELRAAQQALEAHLKAWLNLMTAEGVVLLDLIVRETILTLIRPHKPLPTDLREYPDGLVMCMGMSSLDQGKFSRIINSPENPEAYATISELASWLAKFMRLRSEKDDYRSLIADIRLIIRSFNFDVFDAPYISQLSKEFGHMDELMAVRPEEINGEDLEQLQAQARKVSRNLREIYQRESALAFRDRWLSRIIIRLRAIRPNSKLNFVDQLYEGRIREPSTQAEAQPTEAKAAGDEAVEEKKEEFQTFSARVREVIDAREKLTAKEAFVFSPSNTQARLTLSVIDQLFRLRGLFVPIFADISGCPSFVDRLRTRLPPHCLFDMNAM